MGGLALGLGGSVEDVNAFYEAYANPVTVSGRVTSDELGGTSRIERNRVTRGSNWSQTSPVEASE